MSQWNEKSCVGSRDTIYIHMTQRKVCGKFMFLMNLFYLAFCIRAHYNLRETFYGRLGKLTSWSVKDVKGKTWEIRFVLGFFSKNLDFMVNWIKKSYFNSPFKTRNQAFIWVLTLNICNYRHGQNSSAWKAWQKNMWLSLNAHFDYAVYLKYSIQSFFWQKFLHVL